MNTFYADDTYLKTAKEDPLPKIHIIGGVFAPMEAEQLIVKIINEIKSEYTHENMPIKWNFRDPSIKSIYEEHDRIGEYNQMLNSSAKWRIAIAEKLKDIPFKIILSCIEAYSDDKQKIKKAKNELLTFLFENLLMRVGLEATISVGAYQCVLDWPPEGNPKPFNDAYYRLYHNGIDSTGKKIYAGALSKLGFSPSLFFTKCNHSPLLQLADLVIGATRDHLEAHMQNRSACIGSDFIKLLYPRFRNKNGLVSGYGVIASSGNIELKNSITTLFGSNP